jgi:hypothetical protein
MAALLIPYERPSTSATLSPFGYPSRIASTMSGARQVSGRSRRGQAASRSAAPRGFRMPAQCGGATATRPRPAGKARMSEGCLRSAAVGLVLRGKPYARPTVGVVGGQAHHPCSREPGATIATSYRVVSRRVAVTLVATSFAIGTSHPL